MKKIIFAVIAIYMAGIFAGCSSNQSIVKKHKMTPMDEGQKKSYLATAAQYKDEKKYLRQREEIFDKYYFLDKEEKETEIFNDLSRIIQQPVITKEDLAYILWLPYSGQSDYSEDSKYKPLEDISRMPNFDSNRTEITGRITNTTKESAKFYFPTRSKGVYHFIILNPCETKSFTMPLPENWFYIGIDENGKMIEFLKLHEDTFHEPYYIDKNGNRLYLPIGKEIEKTHSLEIIYDGRKGRSRLARITSYEFDFKFIEPFDYEWED